MKRRLAHGPWLILLTTSVAATAFVFAACDDSNVVSIPDPDGSAAAPDGSSPQPDPATPVDDGAAPVDAGPDAEDITDGGGLPPEDDGGTTDLDGGFDAGPTCAVLTTGAWHQTTCSSRSAILAGGTLTTTNYRLASVTVLGSKTFCGVGGGYVPYEHRGAVEVTATSATTATFEFLDQYRKVSATLTRPTSVRYDVAVSASGGQLTYTPQACAAKAAPGTAGFTVGVLAANGKKTLTLRLPYGTGSALYTYVEP